MKALSDGFKKSGERARGSTSESLGFVWGRMEPTSLLASRGARHTVAGGGEPGAQQDTTLLRAEATGWRPEPNTEKQR